MSREIIKYEVDCTKCGAKKVLDNPNEYYICKKCKNDLPEPVKENYTSAYSYYLDCQEYESIKKKDILNFEYLKELCFKNSTLNKKQLEKIWSYSDMESHAYGLGDIIGTFDSITELIEEIIKIKK